MFTQAEIEFVTRSVNIDDGTPVGAGITRSAGTETSLICKLTI